jgi:hypothetical protein
MAEIPLNVMAHGGTLQQARLYVRTRNGPTSSGMSSHHGSLEESNRVRKTEFLFISCYHTIDQTGHTPHGSTRRSRHIGPRFSEYVRCRQWEKRKDNKKDTALSPMLPGNTASSKQEERP